MKKKLIPACLAACLLLAASVATPGVWALASNNIPLDNPIYLYLEKLAGFGLIKTDMKGIRPFSKSTEGTDFRFEYYLGNSILSNSGSFPEGYLNHGMNIGPSQGGVNRTNQIFMADLSYIY